MIFSSRNPFKEFVFSFYAILLFLMFLILKPCSATCNQDVSISQVMPDSNCVLVAGQEVAVRFEIHAEAFAHPDSSSRIWYRWGDGDFQKRGIRLYGIKQHQFSQHTIRILVPNEPGTRQLLTLVVDLDGDKNHKNDTAKQLIYIGKSRDRHSLEIESEVLNEKERYDPGDTLGLKLEIYHRGGPSLMPGDTLTLLVGERRNFNIPSFLMVKDTLVYEGQELDGNDIFTLNYTIELPESYGPGIHNLFAELYVTKKTDGHLRYYEWNYYRNWFTWSITTRKVGINEQPNPKRVFHYENGMLKLVDTSPTEHHNKEVYLFSILNVNGRILYQEESLSEIQIPRSLSLKNGVYIVTAFNQRTHRRYSQKLRVLNN